MDIETLRKRLIEYLAGLDIPLSSKEIIRDKAELFYLVGKIEVEREHHKALTVQALESFKV